LEAQLFRTLPRTSRSTDAESGRESFESADGNFVYYSKREGGVWRVPSDGGEETPILEETQNWTLAPLGIYFVRSRLQQAISFFDFLTHSFLPVVPIEKSSLSVSSDGRRLLYTQPDETDSDIVLLDNGG
jgi:hypothetical protein